MKNQVNMFIGMAMQAFVVGILLFTKRIEVSAQQQITSGLFFCL